MIQNFSIIDNISILVKMSYFNLVFFKTACHADFGEVRKQAGSS